MLQPVVRRTWAPQGRTPIHYSWDRHDRLSVISALTVSPRRRKLRLHFRIHSNNISNVEVSAFLQAIRRTVGRNLLVIIDRLNAHRTSARRLTERHGSAFLFEWLPAYAPDLNPVEQIWNRTKYTDLANFLPDDIDHLRREVSGSLRSTRTYAHLLHGFFRRAKLDL